MKPKHLLPTLFALLMGNAINASCRSSAELFEKTVFSKSVDSVFYPSVAAFFSTAFYDENRFNQFDPMCISECISFSFDLSTGGEIRIKEFSKFTPEIIRGFIRNATTKLNRIELAQKPFIVSWLTKGYAGKTMLQPILFTLFTSTCIPTNYIARGVLSLLTTDKDSGEFGVGSGMISNLGDYNVEPFEGVLLTAINIKSPFR